MAFGDNQNDTSAETETVSYGSRVGSSFEGMISDILLFLGAFPRLVPLAQAFRDQGQGGRGTCDESFMTFNLYT